jgi:hypothetical protein
MFGFKKGIPYSRSIYLQNRNKTHPETGEKSLGEVTNNTVHASTICILYFVNI